MEIADYVSLLNQLKAETDSESTAIALLQEIGKDKRSQVMKTKSLNGEATEKQLALLEKLDVQHDNGISKAEASRLIDETFASQENHKE